MALILFQKGQQAGRSDICANGLHRLVVDLPGAIDGWWLGHAPHELVHNAPLQQVHIAIAAASASSAGSDRVGYQVSQNCRTDDLLPFLVGGDRMVWAHKHRERFFI